MVFNISVTAVSIDEDGNVLRGDPVEWTYELCESMPGKFVCLSVCLSVGLSVHPAVHLSVCLLVCLSTAYLFYNSVQYFGNFLQSSR